MGPLYETENPPDLAISVPRIEDLFNRTLGRLRPDSVLAKHMEQVIVINTGFSMRAWIDINSILFSFWSTSTFKELMENRARGYLDSDKSHEVISREALQRALDELSVPLSALPDHLHIERFSRQTLFDLTPFRTKPLWRLPGGRVLCVDAGMLMERLGPHAFWTVVNSLDAEDRRKQFSAAWGKAFEDYCLDRLAAAFGSRKWRYTRNPVDTATNEEFCDGLALRDETAVVVECKGTFIKSADKYSGESLQFFKGLSRKFGGARHGGVYQLARAIKRGWFDRTAAVERTDLGSARDIFPVLVVQDPILNCGPVARVLSDRCAAALGKAKRGSHGLPRVWPLTVLSVDDVDMLPDVVQTSGRRIDAIIKTFHRAHPSRMFSFQDYFRSTGVAAFGIPEGLNSAVRQRFEGAMQASLERIRNSEYGGQPSASDLTS
jgi:hypothetical protein